jgi:hypothetical protein
MSAGDTLHDLLYQFTSQDLADALNRARELSSGTKDERATRLVTHAHAVGITPAAVLDLFDTTALRQVCVIFGIRETRKQDMIAALTSSLPRDLPPPHATDEHLVPATLDKVLGFLQEANLSRVRIRDERDAEAALFDLLAARYSGITSQFKVGGYLGHKIDVDLGDGLVGIEIKLAVNVLNSSSEAYRLIGQAIYYDRRRYSGRLVVVLVGPPALRSEPAFGELAGILTSMGISCLYVAA